MKEIAFRWIDKYLINVTIKENFLILFFAPVLAIVIVSSTLVDAAESQQQKLQQHNLKVMAKLIEHTSLTELELSQALGQGAIQLVRQGGHAVMVDGKPMNLALQQQPSLLTQLSAIHITVIISSCLFIAACLYYIMTFMGGALYNIYDAVQRLANGELSFRIGHAPARNDFNLIARTVDRVSEREHQLVKATQEAIALIKQISEGLQKRSQDHKQLTDEQKQRIDSLASATEEMAGSIREVAEHAYNTSSQTSQATGATTQGLEQVDLTVTSISKLGEEIHHAAQAVTELENNTAQIDDVVTSINAISEQTNLLALNAAIEAARAGAQGRGFAVVADEVRNLAGRAKTATVEIKTMIEALQSNSQQLMQAMRHTVGEAQSSEQLMGAVSSDIQHIAEQNSSIADRSIEIATAAEQQGAVASNIAVDVEQVREQSQQVADMVEASNQEIAQLNKQAKVLEALMQGLKV